MLIVVETKVQIFRTFITMYGYYRTFMYTTISITPLILTLYLHEAIQMHAHYKNVNSEQSKEASYLPLWFIAIYVTGWMSQSVVFPSSSACHFIQGFVLECLTGKEDKMFCHNWSSLGGSIFGVTDLSHSMLYVLTRN